MANPIYSKHYIEERREEGKDRTVTKLGQIVYAIGCGVLTVMIRYFGGYNEGVSYAILCMNACVVLLDRIGRPVKFGAPKKEAAK